MPCVTCAFAICYAVRDAVCTGRKGLEEDVLTKMRRALADAVAGLVKQRTRERKEEQRAELLVRAL